MEDKKEFTFEDLFVKVVQVLYWLYFVMGIVGVILFVFHQTKLLIVETILLTILFMVQYGMHLKSFFGVVWLAAGGVVGYILLKSWMGVCLGMNVAVIIRHVVKRIYFKIVHKGLEIMNKV